jgi:hypothetical protein
MQPFYNWCFDYLREDRKILTIEEVQTLWSMLGMPSRWKLWGQWQEFLVKKKQRTHVLGCGCRAVPHPPLRTTLYETRHYAALLLSTLLRDTT